MDVDGEKGHKQIEGIAIPPTVTSITGRAEGGEQKFFRYQDGLKIKSKAGQDEKRGLDSRADGGYVVLPPSRHRTGKKYQWERNPFEHKILETPQEVLDLLNDNNNQNGDKPFTTKPKDWTVPLLEGKTKEKRHTSLLKLAGRFRARGLSEPEILEILRNANAQCEDPLDDEDVVKMWSSYKGQKKPARFFLEKQFLPNLLAEEIQDKHKIICSPIDNVGKGVRLYIYDNGVFKATGEDSARREAYQLLSHLSKPERIEATVLLLKEATKIEPANLNTQALNLINVLNGLLDWRTGKLQPHSPDVLSTFQIHATYNPKIKLDEVDKFLSDVFPTDALSLAEEIIGYLMLPDTKHQKGIMLLGDGGNGKSTFLAMLSSYLGEEHISRVSLQDLVSNRFMRAELQDKLANIYPDLPSSALEQSDTFKNVVVGDPITAERKFGQPFTLKPYARLLFSANQLPQSKDLTYAYFRRWIIIPFPKVFKGKNEDKGILTRLTTDEARSALLNRAVEGLKRLEAQKGFTECHSVKEAGERYRKQCDNVYEFIKEKNAYPICSEYADILKLLGK